MKDVLDLTELDRLDSFLARIEHGAIPNVAALDGMFAALACCPDEVRPSEFLPVIEMGAGGDLVLTDLEEVEQFLGLVVGHWTRVNRLVASHGAYFPPLTKDACGAPLGNDWARGFLTGMKLRRDLWAELGQIEDCAALLTPIRLLAYEDHPDPDLRPFSVPLDHDQRADLISRAVAAVTKLHARLACAWDNPRAEMERTR